MNEPKTYDVAIAWRIYPKVSKKPIYYCEDKFKLVKLSLLSFINSINELNIKYYFILDGCPNEYEILLQELFKNQVFEIIKTKSIGNLKTFEKQIELLTTQNDSDLVYFAEDDYLYRPGAFIKAINFIQNHKNVDFVTGYHHMDTTTNYMHKGKRKYIKNDDIKWQTDISTCLTFLTRKKTLIKTKDIFLTYTSGNNDCAIWLVLTKSHIYNPAKYFIFWLRKDIAFNILKVAIKYSFKYFFHSKKYNLWTSVPALCTHLESGLESPLVNWDEIYQELKNKI